jgi:hypothetical protein
MAVGWDHDHDTQQVRASLCRVHNSAIGALGDSPASLRAVADWLESADMGFTYPAAMRAYNAAWHAAHPEARRNYRVSHLEQIRAHDRERKRIRR